MMVAGVLTERERLRILRSDHTETNPLRLFGSLALAKGWKKEPHTRSMGFILVIYE